MTLMAAYSEIFAKIEISKTTIITPNRRLAQILQSLNDDLQMAKGLNAWRTPDILPYTTWLERLWLQKASFINENQPLLLNTVQESAIWEDIILGSLSEIPLIQVSETAEIAKKAYSLINQWQVNIDHTLFDSEGDYLFFKKWYKQFETKCKEKHWITNAVLESNMSTLILEKNVTLPAHLLFLGFSEFSPAITNIISVCKEIGITIQTVEREPPTKNCSLFPFKEADDEIIAMALWAKKIQEEDPSKKIGCVIPTLSQNRDSIEQVFSEVYENKTEYYNISAGKALLEYPIIHHALQLLNLHPDKISLDQLKLFLTTPFIGGSDSERDKRGLTEISLQEKNITSLRIKNEKNEIDTTQLSAHLSRSHSLLERLLELLKKANIHEINSFRYFAEHFTELLTILGWPGEKTLQSEEYQVIEQWLQLLDQLGSLDYVFEKTNFNNALFILKKMARNHLFQPKSPKAPIQILGLLEAAGAPFDELWVSGLNDQTWPPLAKPNPLIPKLIQREKEMPHSSAERELNYCIKMTHQFQQATKHLIFSYAENLDDLETSISPIISKIPNQEISELKLENYQNPTYQIYSARKIEMLNDQLAPVVIHNGKLLGGIDVIKQQALCPFKAYGKHRLHIKQIDEAKLGLRAKERGIVIHSAMQVIWQKLQNQETLLLISESGLLELIEIAVTKAYEKFEVLNQDQKNLHLLEKARLKNIIFEWMQIEKGRSPFSIQSLEEKMPLPINGIEINVRMDRIDKLANNQLVIIDYKTGKSNNIQHWFGERPDDPQLPLYAMVDNRVTAIAYAQIHAMESKLIGLSREDLEISGIKPFAKLKDHDIGSWQNQIEYWQLVLSKLCDEYLQGNARVTPKNPNETCSQCNLHALCRINEEI